MLSVEQRWQIIVENGDSIYRICARTLLQSACYTMQIDELVSDVQVKLHSALHNYQSDKGELQHYLTATCRALALGCIRSYVDSENRRSQREKDCAHSITQQTEGQDTKEEIEGMLSTLTAREAYIVRKVANGWTYRDVSTVLGIDVRVVHNTYHSALHKLKLAAESRGYND